MYSILFRSPRLPKAWTIEDRFQVKVLSWVASGAPAIKKVLTQIGALPEVSNTAGWPMPDRAAVREGAAVPQVAPLRLVQEAKTAKVIIPAWQPV